MPSSGWDGIPMDDALKIQDVALEAIKQGLFAEWIAWFVGGILEGETPVNAARGAAIEWDF